MISKPKDNYYEHLSKDNPNIYFFAYNGFFGDKKSLFHVMKLQNSCFQKDIRESLNVCTIFYNTQVTPEVIDQYITNVTESEKKIKKLAIVGVPLKERPVFLLKLKRSDIKQYPYQFFSTTTDAIAWLEQ